MGYIARCNMCGRVEPEVNFSEAPLQLQLPNHKGELYNFYVSINLEKDTDARKVMQIMDEVKHRNLEQAMTNMMQGKDKQMLLQEIYSQLEEPDPVVCDRCKKKLSSFLVEHGSFKEMKEF